MQTAKQKPDCTSSASGAPGGQWAFRRSAWDALDGMLQTPILGSADWYMAYALSGIATDPVKDEELGRCAPNYIASIEQWCQRARTLKSNISFLPNHAIHFWHGSYKTRGYGWRWKILATHSFDPATDLKLGPSGLLELAGNKPTMRDEIRAYMASRQEDALA